MAWTKGKGAYTGINDVLDGNLTVKHRFGLSRNCQSPIFCFS